MSSGSQISQLTSASSISSSDYIPIVTDTAGTPLTQKATVADVLALNGVWQDWTPKWTATSVNPSFGNASITAKYLQINKFVAFQVVIQMGSTTTFGTGNWILGTPTSLAFGSSFMVTAFDSNPGLWHFMNMWRPVGNNGSIFKQTDFSGGNSYWSPTVPFTWAEGDRIMVNGIYVSA